MPVNKSVSLREIGASRTKIGPELLATHAHDPAVNKSIFIILDGRAHPLSLAATPCIILIGFLMAPVKVNQVNRTAATKDVKRYQTNVFYKSILTPLKSLLYSYIEFLS